MHLYSKVRESLRTKFNDHCVYLRPNSTRHSDHPRPDPLHINQTIESNLIHCVPEEERMRAARLAARSFTLHNALRPVRFMVVLEARRGLQRSAGLRASSPTLATVAMVLLVCPSCPDARSGGAQSGPEAARQTELKEREANIKEPRKQEEQEAGSAARRKLKTLGMRYWLCV
jgi:hypothetical protein